MVSECLTTAPPRLVLDLELQDETGGLHRIYADLILATWTRQLQSHVIQSAAPWRQNDSISFIIIIIITGIMSVSA